MDSTPSIGFFTTDWSSEVSQEDPTKRIVSYGGTFYHRGAMPALELQNHEWNTHLSWRFDIAADGHIRTMDTNGEWHDPDIFWSQRWMKDGADEMIQRARSTGQICIADLDDQFWHLPQSNVAYQTTDPVTHPDFNRDHYRKMLRACDAVTVSTKELQQEMQILKVPSFIVRNAIDIERWTPNNPSEDGMIGWIGGIQWRARDLDILKVVGLPQFLEDYGLPVYHGGDSQVPGVPKFWEIVGIDPSVTQCAVMPLCHVAMYPNLWKPLNVSLVPLERVRFNQSKSWLKQLESCAAGIPYIVSAKFSEQDLLLSEGGAGRRASNSKPSEWRAHLADLLDPDLRAEEGIQNRKIAENHDIRLKWTDWADVYADVVREVA